MEPMIDLQSDAFFMREALRMAVRAFEAEEVPIGAVVVKDGRIIGRAYNQVELLKDATAHAEMLALTQAEEAYQLAQSTLEPTHPSRLIAMSGLASAYQANGRPLEALPLQQQTLALRISALGSNDLDTVFTRVELAKTFVDLGRREEAISQYEECLKRVLGYAPASFPAGFRPRLREALEALQKMRERPRGRLSVGANEATSLYILPGYQFNAVDAMVTNFHVPRSTLLMLVSAFAGRAAVMSAYETAKQEGYRFLSFGDAMMIL